MILFYILYLFSLQQKEKERKWERRNKYIGSVTHTKGRKKESNIAAKDWMKHNRVQESLEKKKQGNTADEEQKKLKRV